MVTTMNKKERKQIMARLHVTKLNHEEMARKQSNTLHKFYEGWIEALEWVLSL